MIRLLWLLLITALIAGCGSGGSSSAVSDPGRGLGPAPVDTAALVTVSTQAASAGTVLFATEFSLKLPAGVTVAADAATGEVQSDAIHLVDSRAFAGAKYTPAGSGSPGFVKVVISDPIGFTPGDLATIHCTLTPGTSVDLTGFALEQFSARDVNGVAIPGISTHLAVQTQ